MRSTMTTSAGLAAALLVFDGQSPYDRLYGFCGITSPDDLGKLWFAAEKDKVPPSSVYITLTDRLTDRRVKETVKSNQVWIGAPGLAHIRAEPIDCTRAVAVDELAICNSEDLRTVDKRFLRWGDAKTLLGHVTAVPTPR